MYFLEELIEDVNESMIIGRTEDLGHKRTTLMHKLNSKTERVKDQGVLLLMMK